MTNNFSETQKIGDLKDVLKDIEIRDDEVKSPVNRIIGEVYDAMREKGYNPVNQIVGYILSGDPTYITSYKDARKKMSKIEQDELLEEFVTYYIENKL